MKDVRIQKAAPEDAPRLVQVFNLSFYEDFLRYGACPGYNRTVESMLHSIAHYHVYKIMVNDLIVGAIGVQPGQGEGHFFLGALCVIPEYANRGIGSRAMVFLDQEFAHAKLWSLETPSDKMQNHHFYRKFGYVVKKQYQDGGVPISYFERRRFLF